MDEALWKRIGIPKLKERIMHPAKNTTPTHGINPAKMAMGKQIIEEHREVLRALAKR